MSSFDLTKEGWLPCFPLTGPMRLLSLRQLFAQAHELRDLVDESPLSTAALHRMLLVILYRALGPRTKRDWKVLWTVAHFEAKRIGDYLDQWQARFDLFDEKRPFAQVGGLKGDSFPPQCLGVEYAAGNNATLF